MKCVAIERGAGAGMTWNHTHLPMEVVIQGLVLCFEVFLKWMSYKELGREVYSLDDEVASLAQCLSSVSRILRTSNTPAAHGALSIRQISWVVSSLVAQRR